MPLASVAEEPIPELTEADLFITEEVAEYLAGFFIDDMIATGQTVWTDETEIVNTVTMYNEAGEITAYTFELTQGYIVVSAYLDMPNLIMEWADEAEPVYEVFDLEEEDKIVYVDTLNYYLDEGEDTLETVDGGEVPKEEIENSFEEMRDIENVEEEVIEEIVEMKEEAEGQAPRMLRAAINHEGGTITDPFIYAQNAYGGSWVSSSWKNHWENYAHFATTDSLMRVNGTTYYQHCGPVAITNIIKMYGSMYTDYDSEINEASYPYVFGKIIEVNNQNYGGYYMNINSPDGGTVSAMANGFIEESFLKFGIHVGTYGRYAINEHNVVNAVGSAYPERLMYVMLSTRDAQNIDPVHPYGAHVVVGYAYTKLRRVTSSSDYQTFLKICDGRNPSGRYLDVDMLSNKTDSKGELSYTYWEVLF